MAEKEEREREEKSGDKTPEISAAYRLEEKRGREAVRPTRIPWRGWRDIVLRIQAAVGKDHLPIVAAGVAFFLLLGVIPALAALLMLYGYFADPLEVRRHFEGAAHFMPPDVYEIFVKQMEEVSSPDRAAGIGAIFSLLFALWAGSRGTKGMMQALNVAYKENGNRGMIKTQLIGFALTSVMIVLGIIAVLLVAGLPAFIGFLPLATVEETLVSWLRWPILLFIGIFALAVLYRYAPARRAAQWKWVTTGSLVATVLWLVASAGFSYYVSNFGNFNETYGSLGAVVIMLLWLYLTAFLILVGAEINAEMEHQTAEDTTRGKPRPMGERGAYMADHLGKSP